MRIRVKICGVTTVEAIEAAVSGGADAIGFVLTESPRRLEIERARKLVRHVPPFVARVAVLHEPAADLLGAVCEYLQPDVVQCEPQATTSRLDRPFLPVFHDHDAIVSEVEVYRDRHPNPLVHLEASGRGGQGLVGDRVRAAAISATGPTVLAGGLDPATVGAAIDQVQPWAVDVSSGCESTRGVKDPELILRFLEAVRRTERSYENRSNETTPQRDLEILQ